MNRPTILLKALLADASLATGVLTTKDAEVIQRRVEHEGFSFLTITLPVVSDYLERGIEAGRLDPSLAAFFRFQNKRRLPRFLGGFFSRVFDSGGLLLRDPCPDSILAIRQISRAFKKLFMICDESRNSAAARRYHAIEEELLTYDDAVTRCDPILDGVATELSRVLCDPLEGEDIVCRHGPGSTAERRSANQRYSVNSWTRRASDYFAIEDHAIPNLGLHDDLSNITELGLDEEPPVRVVFVPKTALTPRVIAVEPSHMQYMQQGIMSYMVRKIERHPLTRGRINFARQDINQRMARRSSIDRRFATIDLKDASDRVHYSLAKRIFRHTSIWGYLDSSRSLKAALPDGTIVNLRKFASMGSATCFPTEAYVFFCLILSAIHVHQRQLPTPQSVCKLSKVVYVYGDDIIVPSEYVNVVCSYLESYGLVVNRNKTFSVSHFRESCGADFYRGQAVKPVYFRQLIPEERTSWTPTQLLAWTSSSNQLYMSGYWKASQLIREWIESEVGRIPRCVAKVTHGSWENPNGLLFVSVAFNTGLRWSNSLQCLGWKVRDFKTVRVPDIVPTYSGMLFKAFQNIGEDVPTDFMFSHKRDVLKPKHRWASLIASKNLF